MMNFGELFVVSGFSMLNYLNKPQIENVVNNQLNQPTGNSGLMQDK
jgi:hypothetical protein